ncbi:hypothetical protein WCX49_11625 [Sulfurimonas sp. HSL-1656]|uniref:hypothetical protein n=1 Tax=Thiomicrolovo subterrani TaxID=3131934 RepID=UPI0031F82B06
MTISYAQLFSYLFAFVTFESILQWSITPSLPLLFWWGFNSIFLAVAFMSKSIYYQKAKDRTPLLIVKVFMMWCFLSFLRGLFIADNYWEWKNLFSIAFVYSIPLFVFLFINDKLLKQIISFWLKYMLIIFLLFIPFIVDTTFIGQYLSPLLLLLLLLPVIPYRWRVFIVIITFCVIIFSLESRSTVIKFSTAFLFGSMYYARFFQIEKFFKIMHISLIIAPIILFFLALTNTFNVFHMKDYLGGYTINTSKTSDASQGDLTADTRTFIYVETISSAIKHDYIIQGRTPARGYDSVYFGDYLEYELGTGKKERFASEVSILNVFTWFGLIGVFLYFLVFFYSSYLAVYRSNNYFIRIVGLFVAFRWAFSFVEDPSSFGIQTIVLWIFISMCLSSSFRKMTNNEFRFWINDLLNRAKLLRLRT